MSRFDEVSFRNRVEYYREQLLKMHFEGARSLDVFTTYESRCNRKYGLLVGTTNRNLHVSSEALKILGVK